MDDEKVRAFLTDLAALSQRHGISIEGCGCCMSPSLVPWEPGQHYYVAYRGWSKKYGELAATVSPIDDEDGGSYRFVAGGAA